MCCERPESVKRGLTSDRQGRGHSGTHGLCEWICRIDGGVAARAITLLWRRPRLLNRWLPAGFDACVEAVDNTERRNAYRSAGCRRMSDCGGVGLRVSIVEEDSMRPRLIGLL